LRRTERRENLDAVADAMTLIRSAVTPIAVLLSELRAADGRKRSELLGRLQSHAVAACLLPFERVEGARAILYVVADDGKSMTPIWHFGRQDDPGPHVRGSLRGDRAFRQLENNETLFIADLDAAKKEHPKVWAHCGEGYATFVAAPIAANHKGFGMLSVDAPIPGTIGSRHVQFVETLASLLGIAYLDTKLRSSHG
jgi:transcriptional regulator with GAF, ATPase, and Fis domain